MMVSTGDMVLQEKQNCFAKTTLFMGSGRRSDAGMTAGILLRAGICIPRTCASSPLRRRGWSVSREFPEENTMQNGILRKRRYVTCTI